MQNPKFPYDRSRCTVSQTFGADHNGWDIVPNYKRFDGLPADCYPILDGRAVAIADVDPVKGKGIRVRTDIWPHLAEHLASHGIKRAKRLECLYWHFLDVTDVDGTVDQQTPLGITGNTGSVYSNGKPVPDSEKGKPPYRGLHLHLETVVDGRRVDPAIIFNYKAPTEMRLVNDSGTYFLVGENGKIGIADSTALGLLKMLTSMEEQASTAGIPEVAVFEKASASLTAK